MNGALFTDRTEAGKALARRLEAYRDADAVVLGLPRGGVPVAAEIATALGAPLDLLLVRKIGAPGHAELAVGAVVDGPQPEIVVNAEIADKLGLSADKVREMAQGETAEIARRRRQYLGENAALSLAGRTVILVDDGIATGASVKAALKALRHAGPAEIVLAVPLAPAETLEALAPHADAIVCLATPAPFVAVGGHYRDFPQTSDEEVVTLLRAAGRL